MTNDPQKQNDLDLDGLLDSAVGLGSDVLSGIAAALHTAGDALGSRKRDRADPFARYRRRLDARLSGSQGGWLAMAIVGGTFFFCFGVAALVMAILYSAAPGTFALMQARRVFSILTPVFSALTLGFGVMGFIGCRETMYFQRLRRYLRVSQGFAVPVTGLARDSLTRPDKVRQDLTRAVADGQYPNACLDAEGTTFYWDDSLCAAPEPETPAEESADEPEKFRQEGAEFLSYLRCCTGRLGQDTDEELTTMQKNCSAILGFVHNHPEQLPRVRRFRDYYLPTTRKLLDVAQGLPGPDTRNAQTIRRDITGILHTLNTAFATLYDTLLQDVSLDVSTEIDALEAMLGRDGLTSTFESDFGSKEKKGSSAL
ncbi:MAG: hypothetical protein U0L91_09230 [Gemmiger sp.]|uniref:hypothetical protein n=1 Tax=Gemmiger sp. TaxID=2049027 RepID=UPI002E76E146|nr:hypothetical protein [Gemmiger sp.]MEE0801446.1 hypothetical protein [Gemmiger sp.]